MLLVLCHCLGRNNLFNVGFFWDIKDFIRLDWTSVFLVSVTEASHIEME